jgi:hypothetical protein
MESIGLEVYVGQLGRHPLCIYAATKRIKVAAKKDINRRRNLDSSRSLYILGFATGNSSHSGKSIPFAPSLYGHSTVPDV